MKKIVFVTLLCVVLGACQQGSETAGAVDTTKSAGGAKASDSARLSSDSMVNASPDTLKAN